MASFDNTCQNCKGKLKRNNYLVCCSCKKAYDLNCADVSEKRYQIMRNDSERDRRLVWNCKSCHKLLYKATNTGQGRVTPKLVLQDKNKNKPNLDALNPDVNIQLLTAESSAQLNIVNLTPGSVNIDTETAQNQNTAVAKEGINVALQNSFELLPTDDDKSSDIDDSHVLTKDDISEKSYSPQSEGNMSRIQSKFLSKSTDTILNETETLIELNEELMQVKAELLSTQDELENTIIENMALKSEIKTLSSNVATLKKLCLQSTSDQLHGTPIRDVRKRTANSTTKKKLRRRTTIANDFNSEEEVQKPFSLIYLTEIEKLQELITALEVNLETAKTEIKTLNQEIDLLRSKLQQTEISMTTLET
ncbi:hypothetical protein O0L34_g15321 [Tuta absoluta]|nr:hypothetical protein O0L34_g15321 [Tuta absoluta]